MALTDAEIAEIKAGIPARFQPPHDSSGALTMNFQNQGAMLAPFTLQGSADLDRHNIGLAFINSGDQGSTPGFMLSGALATIRATEKSEIEKRKRGEEQRFALDQLNAQLDARLAELDAELAQIDERLEEIRQRRIEIGDGLEALDELEHMAATGTLDPDNPDHARLLRRAGIEPEDARRRDMTDIIAQRRRDMSREDGALHDENDGLLKRRDTVAREKKEVEAARAEIENADTPEAMKAAEHRARTVLGSQQLGEAAYQTENQQAKVIAASAVGVSAKSEDYNRNAASLDENIVITMDDSGPKF
ncbi:MAG: hypothetical protein K9G33_07720 [Sneathiella sp.]|nr:hypothetical protein [Sneathiella sp.]